LTAVAFAPDAAVAVVVACMVTLDAVTFAVVTFVMHPSFLKRAHSSQLVPLGKVHIPYWLPSAAVLISVVPPILPQLTDAGFAIPALATAGVVATDVAFDTFPVAAVVGTSVAEAVAMDVVTVGTVVWAAAGACCCVHPATNKPATMQVRRITKILVLDIIIIPDTISMPRIKRSPE